MQREMASTMTKSVSALPSLGKSVANSSLKALGGSPLTTATRVSVDFVTNAHRYPTIRMAASSAASHGEPESKKSEEGKSEISHPEERGVVPGEGGRFGLLSTPFGSTFADLWHPWMPSRSMRQMLQMADKIFEDFTSGAMAGPMSRMGELTPLRTSMRPPWDVQETEQDFKLRIDMPGMKKEEVKVNLEDGNILCIRGEHKEEKEEGGKEKWRSSRYGNYQTRVELPDNAKVEEIKAHLDHGVLHVVVPKAPMEQPKSIDITVD